MSAPLVTIIICTRNRAASLGRTLNSIVDAYDSSSMAIELLVVDNGSTDDTAQTIASFASQLPIRRVFEPEPGLSNARNAGVRQAEGQYIIWTDDDVLVDRGWLRAWLDAFARHPDDALFGGRTEPIFDEPRQAWFAEGREYLKSLLAIRDERDWSSITNEQVPFGLNYAVRSVEQKRFPYDPELGVAPGRRRGGEETAVIRALLASGATGSWVWDATVFHIIPPERQTRAYVKQYYLSNGYDFPIGGVPSALGARLNRYLFAGYLLLKSYFKYYRHRWSGSSDAVKWLVVGARARGSMARISGRKI